MICIHPTVTHNKATLAALQVATGLRVTLGQSYLRLVNHDGTTPACKQAKVKPSNKLTSYTGPYNGGDAA